MRNIVRLQSIFAAFIEIFTWVMAKLKRFLFTDKPYAVLEA
jgi:hypothetical protein